MSSKSQSNMLGSVIRATAALLLSAVFGWTQPTWPPWALNPQHTGQINVTGQPLNRILTDIVYDPLVPQEKAANQGNLLAHYQVPPASESRLNRFV